MNSRWKRALKRPQTWIGGILVSGVVLGGLFAPWLRPHDPLLQNLDLRELPPGTTGFLLGTDHLGRCLFSRVLTGAQISLAVALSSVLFSFGVGVPAGALAGYFGGWTDRILSRSVEALQAFPSLLLAVILAGLGGRSMGTLILAIGVVGIPAMFRQARAGVLAEARQEYVLAARGLGSPEIRILAREVLPNTLGPLWVLATLGLATAILDAAGLSFLGLGAEPGSPEWGSMIASGRSMMLRAPWILTVPGLAIVAAVLGFNLLGDVLGDVFDPRRGRRS